MERTQPHLPARFGPFFLYDLIGQGGMAEIFLAKGFTSLGTERQTVIKRILPHLSSNGGFGEMLIQEAKLCARLSHANVVQTFDLGQIDGQYYINMEYVEGFDLNRLLGLLARERLALPLPFALRIIIDTLRGLDYAHRLADGDGRPLGIIHRDVSPTNVLISTQGEVKVCDFGIAKVAMSDFGAEHIDEYHLKGKVAYMAPEHLNNEPIDRRADLFAAGILLFELLAGRRLFKAKDEAETLRRAKAVEIPPLVNRGFPEFERLEAIVEKALAKSREDRFQSGQDFIAAIDDYMHTAGLIASQLKLSEFLMERFGENLMRQRRERERSLASLAEFQEGQAPAEEPAPTTPADIRAAAIKASFAGFSDADADEISGETDLGETGSAEPVAEAAEPESEPAAVAFADAQRPIAQVPGALANRVPGFSSIPPPPRLHPLLWVVGAIAVLAAAGAAFYLFGGGL